MEYEIKSLTPDLAEDYFDFFDNRAFQMDRHSIRVIAMHSI